MGGDHDLVRRDGPAGRHRLAGAELQHLGALKDPQIPSDGSEKSQRMELGLPGKLHRPRRWEGQRRLPDQDSRRAGPGQGFQFLLQIPPVGRVDEIIPLLKIAAARPGRAPGTAPGPPGWSLSNFP